VKRRDKGCKLDCKDLKLSTCEMKKVSLWISLPIFLCGRARINSRTRIWVTSLFNHDTSPEL
jgi:hypothetical protein